jgi:transposase InsO family protein
MGVPSVVIDAWSRRVVGRSMADHLRVAIVVDALDNAVAEASSQRRSTYRCSVLDELAET